MHLQYLSHETLVEKAVMASRIISGALFWSRETVPVQELSRRSGCADLQPWLHLVPANHHSLQVPQHWFQAWGRGKERFNVKIPLILGLSMYPARSLRHHKSLKIILLKYSVLTYMIFPGFAVTFTINTQPRTCDIKRKTGKSRVQENAHFFA
jgi:hypothetical protein